MEKEKVIRVLHYIGSLNIGGSQTMVMELYRKIDKSKVQFDFIVDRKNELLYYDEIIKLGGKVFIFDEYYRGYNHFAFIKQLDSFLDKHKEYNIIHCHVRSVASIILKIAKRRGLITIAHSHSTSNGTGVKSIIKKLLQSNICKYSDYLLACSRQSAIWLYGEKNCGNRCYVLNNSIDSNKYKYNNEVREYVRKKLNIENKIVIGQVGRLANMKNHLFSLKVLYECVKINPNYCLLIVGDGDLKSQIKKEIITLGLENNVIMLGNRTDVNELLQAMDIFLMPSIFEGLPLSLVEAQASSLLCFISNNVQDGILDDNLVISLSLDDGAKKWANEINSKLHYIRKDTRKLISDNNFDSSSNSKWICNFYQMIVKGR